MEQVKDKPTLRICIDLKSGLRQIIEDVGEYHIDSGLLIVRTNIGEEYGISINKIESYHSFMQA